MGTEAKASDVDEGGGRPLLRAVEVGGWPGLGGDVRLELAERCTVLVGKNGAGKSLLLGGLHLAAHAAAWGLAPVGVPPSLRCEVRLPGDPPIAYEYRVSTNDTNEETEVF